jgi:predicted metal-binding membrane protein
MPMSVSDLGEFARSALTLLPASLVDVWLMFMMWAVMMIAMMLPSAAPMVETYVRIVRPHTASPWPRTALFVSGYIIVWIAFSAIATAGQYLLQRAGIVTNALTTVPTISALLLILAGLYQVTPLKAICLTGCRSPLSFFMTSWRDGASGAVRMGLRHGLFCLGCCWMLMLLLFVFGVMNLLWVAALSAFVIIEKLLPAGQLVARGTGAAMIAAGLLLLV